MAIDSNEENILIPNTPNNKKLSLLDKIKDIPQYRFNVF